MELTYRDGYLCFNTGAGDEGRTVKEVLRTVYGLSSTKIRSVKFDPRGLLVDGVRVRVDRVLHAGEELRVLAEDSEERDVRLVPYEMPLDILYEDEGILIVNKPSGIVCHPSIGHYCDTLANAAQFYFDSSGSRARVHLTGRLDKDTSGAVIIAKNSVADMLIKAQQESGVYAKTYLALVHGGFDAAEGVIDTPMIPVTDPVSGIKRMEPAGDEGQSAHTEYRVAAQAGGVSLLEVAISTGRMHQIRYHMSSIGHPLLGDSLYGAGGDGYPRAMLHAWKIRCESPFSGASIHTEAPLPDDFAEAAGEPAEIIHILKAY